MAEIILGAIALFLFKERSRHNFNQDRKQEYFVENYERLFRLRMPHMDTVDKVLRELSPDELEVLKATLVSQLIEKKVFSRFRLFDQWYRIVIDGTWVSSFHERHCANCLHKTSSKGTITYFHAVLEAKLVTPNGMAISLGSEWLSNESPQQSFDKQDCEQAAFKRLVERLKRLFPRLPICILVDGLYPNHPFFTLCEKNNWKFITVFKDGNLPSVQEEIALLMPITKNNSAQQITLKKDQQITQNYRWVSGVEYQGHMLNWVECIEEITPKSKTEKEPIQTEQTRFVYLTNYPVNEKNVAEITDSGRLRWIIENQGFNVQKNNGYELEHKFSRISFNAMKNYYQCLQLAHCIAQFVEKSTLIKDLKEAKFTISYIWSKILIPFLIYNLLDTEELNDLYKTKHQIRLTG